MGKFRLLSEPVQRIYREFNHVNADPVGEDLPSAAGEQSTSW
jgi:hypothetical protein